jgi:hypothetical protein
MYLNYTTSLNLSFAIYKTVSSQKDMLLVPGRDTHPTIGGLR